jgi:two-component system, NarL family, nitrate/nitrite response regulator NarL
VTGTELTRRERQIIRALLHGGTNLELATRLGVREQTIKNVLSMIYAKLGVRNRLELSIYAARHGLDRNE